MEAVDLKQHIAHGENTTVEFKESFDQEAIETAAAFANTDGGTILIGVSDRRDIRGIAIGKETLRDVSNRISQTTEPRVGLEIGAIDVVGKYPQRFFYNAQLRVVRFKGTSVIHPVIDRLDCFETLWENVNAAEEFIRRNIRLLSLRNTGSFQRDDKFEYPLDALREAIINALIHRDYHKPADVRVFIFDNRIEIINPGNFPEGVSPDEPTHNPVNPTLSQLMYDVGFIERYGAGIRMMHRLCAEWGNKGPRYELHPLETKIIFDSPIQDSTLIEIDDISEQLNDRQKNALFHVQKNSQITTKEYVEINHVSRRVAYEELKDMTDKSLLFMIGKGRGTKYMKKAID